MTQECGEIRRLLSAWIDGELTGTDRRRVARHVEGCPDCRDEADALGRIDGMLRAEQEAGDPGDAYFAAMGERIHARFDLDDAARGWSKPEDTPRSRGPTVPRVWIPRFAFGVAATAVAVIAFILVHDLRSRPILAPTPVAETAGGPEAAKAPTSLSAALPETRAPETASKQTSPPSTASNPERPSAPPATTVTPPATRGQLTEPTVGLRVEVTRVLPDRVPEQAPPLAPEDGGAKVASALEAHPPALATPEVASASLPPDSTTPDRLELLAYFGALIDTETAPAGGAAAPAAVQRQQAPESPAPRSGARDAIRVRSLDSPSEKMSGQNRPTDASMVRKEAATQPASEVPDSTWVRRGRADARALADSALAAGTQEGCKNALRAYWRMLHRDGRALFPDAAARAKALEPDRLRIVNLLHCASR